MPRVLRLGLGLVPLICLCGCYLSHERGDGGPRRDTGGGLSDRDPPADRVLRDRFIPGEDGGPDRDAGDMDAGLRDAGNMDGGRDSGRRDAGRMDAGRMDAGRRDSGRRDAGMLDGGRRSVALHFERRHRLVVGSSPRLGLTGDQTLELWIRPLGADGVVMLKGDHDAQYHHGVLLQDGDVLGGWTTPAGPRFVRAPVVDGEWTHVAIVYALDAASALMTVTLHLNGEVVATSTFPADISDAVNDLELIFGNFMAVDVDEVRIWGLARATTDIIDGMNRRISPSAPGLVAYWRMDEFGGQIVLDRSLNGHDAILGDMTMRDAADPEWITDGPI